MQLEYITTDEKMQVLADISAQGRERPWRLHRLEAQAMATIMAGWNPEKANNIGHCAEWLEFEPRETGLHLTNARFCRARLCPICQWRRSLKLGGQTARMVDECNRRRLAEHGVTRTWAWVMLTLTVRNCDPEELADTVRDMLAAWTRLTRLKAFKSAVVGWQRSIEITLNNDPTSSAYHTAHPHIHALLCVRPAYFSGRDYISKPQWAAMWRDALRANPADYADNGGVPVIDVHKIKARETSKEGRQPIGQAVTEVSKYTVKPADYIITDDLDWSSYSLQTLESALGGVRLVAFGGLLRQVRHDLNQDDPIDGDLIHTDESAKVGDQAATVAKWVFAWSPGIRNYIKTR